MDLIGGSFSMVNLHNYAISLMSAMLGKYDSSLEIIVLAVLWC